MSRGGLQDREIADVNLKSLISKCSSLPDDSIFFLGQSVHSSMIIRIGDAILIPRCSHGTVHNILDCNENETMIDSITVDFGEFGIHHIRRTAETVKVRYQGNHFTCSRSQFPLRIANQGSNLHSFNGLTAQRIQLVISHEDTNFSYWSIEHPVSAHGRTPTIDGVTYASPPGKNLNKDDIIQNVAHATSQLPSCGDSFFNWLYYSDETQRLNPARLRRDAPLRLDGVNLLPVMDHLFLGIEAVVYVLYSEVILKKIEK